MSPHRRRFVINRVKCASQVCGRMQHVGEMSTHDFFWVFSSTEIIKFVCCKMLCPVFNLSNTHIRVSVLIRSARHGNNMYSIFIPRSSYPALHTPLTTKSFKMRRRTSTRTRHRVWRELHSRQGKENSLKLIQQPT